MRGDSSPVALVEDFRQSRFPLCSCVQMMVLVGLPRRSHSILLGAGHQEATLASKMTFVGKWEDGRIALLSGGRRRWYLERRWQGRQMSLALLGVRDDRGAVVRLIASRDDPAGFMERADRKRRARESSYTTRSFYGPSTWTPSRPRSSSGSCHPATSTPANSMESEWVRHLAGQDLTEVGRLLGSGPSQPGVNRQPGEHRRRRARQW